MYTPQYEFTSFNTLPPEAKMRVICKMLNVLHEANLHYLHRHPHTPELYDAGVRYIEEKLGHDQWQDIPRTLELRGGDCEDLASWRVSELRFRGENARHMVEHRRGTDMILYHIKVVRADGTIEDPSAVLGMPGGHLGKGPPHAMTKTGQVIDLRREPILPQRTGAVVGGKFSPYDLPDPLLVTPDWYFAAGGM